MGQRRMPCLRGRRIHLNWQGYRACTPTRRIQGSLFGCPIVYNIIHQLFPQKDTTKSRIQLTYKKRVRSSISTSIESCSIWQSSLFNRSWTSSSFNPVTKEFNLLFDSSFSQSNTFDLSMQIIHNHLQLSDVKLG